LHQADFAVVPHRYAAAYFFGQGIDGLPEFGSLEGHVHGLVWIKAANVELQAGLLAQLGNDILEGAILRLQGEDPRLNRRVVGRFLTARWAGHDQGNEEDPVDRREATAILRHETACE